MEQLGNTDVVTLRPGRRHPHHRLGRGGYGDPLARPAEAVLLDVRRGLVSAAAARRDYRVALDAAGGLDVAETARLRHAPHPPARGVFTLCAARAAHERIWTPDRYDALTALLARLPVHWRHFVKHRLFDAVATPGAAADVEAAFAALAAAHPELRPA